MRKTTFYFLCIEFLDIVTTFVGLRVGLWETNPLVANIGWGTFIVFKIILVLCVAVILQKKKVFWFDASVLLIALLPVVWNALNLVLVMIFS
jgi:hypothetical protein